MEYVMGGKWSDPPLSEKQKEMVAAAVRENYRRQEIEFDLAPHILLGRDEPIKVFSSQRELVMSQARDSLQKIRR